MLIKFASLGSRIDRFENREIEKSDNDRSAIFENLPCNYANYELTG